MSQGPVSGNLQSLVESRLASALGKQLPHDEVVAHAKVIVELVDSLSEKERLIVEHLIRQGPANTGDIGAIVCTGSRVHTKSAFRIRFGKRTLAVGDFAFHPRTELVFLLVGAFLGVPTVIEVLIHMYLIAPKVVSIKDDKLADAIITEVFRHQLRFHSEDLEPGAKCYISRVRLVQSIGQHDLVVSASELDQKLQELEEKHEIIQRYEFGGGEFYRLHPALHEYDEHDVESLTAE